VDTSAGADARTVTTIGLAGFCSEVCDEKQVRETAFIRARWREFGPFDEYGDRATAARDTASSASANS
jgi:hypothetical protein